MNPILLLNHCHPEKTQDIIECLKECGQSSAPLFLYCPTEPLDQECPWGTIEEEILKTTLLLKQTQRFRDSESLETFLLLDDSPKTLGQAHLNALKWTLSHYDQAHVLYDHCLPTNAFFNTHNRLLETYKNKQTFAVSGGYPLETPHGILKTKTSDFSAFSIWRESLNATLKLLETPKNPQTKPLCLGPLSKTPYALETLLAHAQKSSQWLSLTPTARLHTQTDCDGSHPPLPQTLLGVNEESENLDQWEQRNKAPIENPSIEKRIRRGPLSLQPLQKAAFIGFQLTPKRYKNLWLPHNKIQIEKKKPLHIPNPFPTVNAALLGGTIAILLGCLATHILITKRQGEIAQSTQSLRRAWEAIQNYTQDHGHPPSPNAWFTHTEYAEGSLDDPTYVALAGGPQPGHSGWGLNTKLHLYPNNPQQILALGPSFLPKFSPKFDGSQNPQALSSTNPTLTEHNRRIGSSTTSPGSSALYATLSGEILQLTPAQAAQFLKTPAHGPHKASPPWATASSGFDRTLETDPAPPTPNKQTILTLEVPPEKYSWTTLQIKTASTGTLELLLSPKNRRLQEINSPEEPESEITSVSAGGVYLKTKPTFLPSIARKENPAWIWNRKGILAPKTVAINPQDGHARFQRDVQSVRIKNEELVLDFGYESPTSLKTLQHGFTKGTKIGAIQNTEITTQFESPTPNKWSKLLIGTKKNQLCIIDEAKENIRIIPLPQQTNYLTISLLNPPEGVQIESINNSPPPSFTLSPQKTLTIIAESPKTDLNLPLAAKTVNSDLKDSIDFQPENPQLVIETTFLNKTNEPINEPAAPHLLLASPYSGGPALKVTLHPPPKQTTIAQDNAENYNSAWNDNSNKGTGFEKWAFTKEGQGGQYIGPTALGNTTFGLFSYGGESSFATAKRPLKKPLGAKTTLSLLLQPTQIQEGGEIGVQIWSNKTNDLPAINFRVHKNSHMGKPMWTLWDGGEEITTNIPLNDTQPTPFALTYLGDNKYEYDFGGKKYSRQAKNNISSLNQVSVYSKNQGINENIGFNNLSVTETPLNDNYMKYTNWFSSLTKNHAATEINPLIEQKRLSVDPTNNQPPILLTPTAIFAPTTSPPNAQRVLSNIQMLKDLRGDNKGKPITHTVQNPEELAPHLTQKPYEIIILPQKINPPLRVGTALRIIEYKPLKLHDVKHTWETLPIVKPLNYPPHTKKIKISIKNASGTPAKIQLPQP